MSGQFNDDTSHDAMRNSIEMTITVSYTSTAAG